MRSGHPLSPPDLDGLLGRENLFLVATRPGDVGGRCAALLRRAGALGRPAVVAVLTDGSAGPPGTPPERAARDAAAGALEAARRFGIPEDDLLLIGLHDGTAAPDGPLFRRMAGVLGNVLWRRDCTLVCGPSPAEGDAAAAAALARALAAEAGLGLLSLGPDAAVTADPGPPPPA